MDDGVLRRLPPVGTVLDQDVLAEVRNRRGHETTVRAVRAAIDEAREGLAEWGADCR